MICSLKCPRKENKETKNKQKTKTPKHTNKQNSQNKKPETPATNKQQGGGAADGRDLIPYKERNDRCGEKERIKIDQRNYRA